MSLFQFEREGDVEKLLSVTRTSDNPEVKARAAKILGDFDDDTREGHDVSGRLVKMVQEEDDDEVAAASVDALNDIGPEAIEELLAEMADIDLDQEADWAKAKAFANALDADMPELRMAAANAIGELGKTDVLPQLLEVLDDPDPRVRARVARACGRLEDARACDALIERLQDPKAKVRKEAAESLGAIGNRQSLNALLEMFDDERPVIRRIAIGAMGKFGDAKPVDGLIEALSDENPSVRRTAVYSIIELLSNVPTQQSHEIRETVVESFNATDNESVIVPMVKILEESNQDRQRRNTTWLLGRVCDPDTEGYSRVVDALIDALYEEDQMTKQFAATSLAEIGGTQIESRLLDIVDDTGEDADVRAQAVYTLGKVGGERSRKRLNDLIDQTDNEQMRKKAFSAVSKLGGRGLQ